jgi:hypothetical protein
MPLFFLLIYGGGVFSAPHSDTGRVVIRTVVLPAGLKSEPVVIHRELTFAVGDTLTVAALAEAAEQSRINLVNTSLFLNHRVEVLWTISGAHWVDVEVMLRERWYFWPEPVLDNAERNFNIWMEERDFRRLSWGVNLITENVRGRRERLTAVLRLGYDEKFELTWNEPMFRGSRVWGFGLGGGFTRNHEVAYDITDNRREFIRDETYIFSRTYAFFRVHLRPGIHRIHTFSMEVEALNIDDTLFVLNPDFMHGAGGRHVTAAFSWFLKIDHRDQRAYPLSGHYADLLVRQSAVSLRGWGSPSFTEAEVNLRFYHRLNDNIFHAMGFAGRVVSRGDLPYYYQRGLGYRRHFVRGYEYYVMHGAAYALFRQNLKFSVLPKRAISLRFMPHEKFRDASLAIYLNIFSDAGYVSAAIPPPEAMVNMWLSSAGIGLDVVIYYDKVMRLEATINDRRKGGFFLHFIAPI